MKRQNRRKFIEQIKYIPALSLAGCRTLSNQNSNPESYASTTFRIRRNLWSSNSQMSGLDDFEKAVGLLKNLPPSDYRSWINLAGIHRDSSPHGNSFFLPWHRAYLDFFEKICMQVLGKPFALPYWNWSENSAVHPSFLNPESPLFHARRDIANPQDSMQSRFRAFEPNAEDPWTQDALEKIQTSSNFVNYVGRVKTLPNVRTNDQLKAQRQAGFGTVEGALGGGLESGAHNLTHVYVGGDMEDMMSPLDPLFWVHHANIDRLWAQWCRKNPTKTLPNNSAERSYWIHFQLIGLFYQTKLPDVLTSFGPYSVAFTKSVESVLTTDQLGYRFDATATFESQGLTRSHSPRPDPFVLEVETRGLTPKIDKNVITFNLSFSDRGYGTIQQMLQRFESRRYSDASFSLQAIGLSEPSNKRGMIEFYFDHPSLRPPANKSSNSPYFIGRIGFFGHNRHDSIVSISLDLAQVIAQLRKNGWKLGKILRLQMVVRGKLQLSPAQFNSTKLRLEYIETA